MVDSGGGRRISIHPVTRIEGHAKITLDLDGEGRVRDAHFHVNEFRGFEKFCEGRVYTEMPAITPRICGICPVSHAVASAKACEMIMRLEIPGPAVLLRRLMHLGQILASHALSFFYLSSPDFLLGWDSAPEARNILGIADKFPDLARRGIRLRKFGQELSEKIAGKKIHAGGLVAGGMARPLPDRERKELRGWIPEAAETARIALDIFKKYRESHLREVDEFARFETLYLGTVTPAGEHELYDGRLRFCGPRGEIIADALDPRDYLNYISEEPVDWSYLKNPFYKPLGYPEGVYRVGPLARLNVASRMQTEWAEREFREYRDWFGGGPAHGSFYYHHARLIEIVTAVEQISAILDDPKVISSQVYAEAGRNQAEGVGCSEAPRGTLFHHYLTDEDGVLKKVNLLIATGQNNPAMNRSVLEVARQFVRGSDLREGALNRVEAAIRCYDPCLSCSTHAIGAMPLEVEIRDVTGKVRNVIRRGR